MKRLALSASLALVVLGVGCQYEFSDSECARHCDAGDHDCYERCEAIEVEESEETPPGDDWDRDGIPDDRERDCNTHPEIDDTDGDGTPDGLEDPDGDGFTNVDELDAGTDPADGESHPDTGGCPNETTCPVVDTDGDRLSDDDEPGHGCDPNNPDSDGDGVLDGVEVGLDTDPSLPDTDGDGDEDGAEMECGADPRDPASVCDEQIVCPVGCVPAGS